jgi:hypothetical protein
MQPMNGGKWPEEKDGFGVVGWRKRGADGSRELRRRTGCCGKTFADDFDLTYWGLYNP